MGKEILHEPENHRYALRIDGAEVPSGGDWWVGTPSAWQNHREMPVRRRGGAGRDKSRAQ